jgi:hypothetical protein
MLSGLHHLSRAKSSRRTLVGLLQHALAALVLEASLKFGECWLGVHW